MTVQTYLLDKTGDEIREMARDCYRRRAYYAKHGVTLGRVARRVVPLSDGHTMPDRDYPDVTVISTDDVGEDWA